MSGGKKERKDGQGELYVKTQVKKTCGGGDLVMPVAVLDP